MRLDIKTLAFAAMLAWAGWYTICAFLVAVAPAPTQAVFSYVFHYELTGSRPITMASYFLGVVGTSIWVGVFVASLGWFFTALGGRRRDRRTAVGDTPCEAKQPTAELPLLPVLDEFKEH